MRKCTVCMHLFVGALVHPHSVWYSNASFIPCRLTVTQLSVSMDFSVRVVVVGTVTIAR